jgi:hypothetical protein
MRTVRAPLFFAIAFALGFNTFGAYLTVKARVQAALAVSTTTITSSPVEH